MIRKYFVLVLLLTSSFALRAQSKAIDILDQFMTYSQLETLDKEKRKALIAPSFWKNLQASKEEARVNMYVPHGYEILQAEGDIYKVSIWGVSKSWMHELSFRVVMEDEQYYIRPNDVSELSEWGYFDAFLSVRRDVNNDSE